MAETFNTNIPYFELFPLQNARTAYQPVNLPLILVLRHAKNKAGTRFSDGGITSAEFLIEDAPASSKVAGYENKGILVPALERYKITLTSTEITSAEMDLDGLSFISADTGSIIDFNSAQELDTFSYTTKAGETQGIVTYYPDATYYDLSSFFIETADLKPIGDYIFSWKVGYKERVLSPDNELFCVGQNDVFAKYNQEFNHPGDIHQYFTHTLDSVFFQGKTLDEDETFKFLRPMADILQDVHDESEFLRNLNHVDNIPGYLIPYLGNLLGWDLPYFDGADDDTRRRFIKNVRRLQELRGSKLVIRELFEIFGFTIDIINLQYSKDGEKFLGPNDENPDGDNITLEEVVRTDPGLVNYSQNGFGQFDIPLLHRPTSDSKIVVEAWQVDSTSTLGTQLNNLSQEITLEDSSITRDSNGVIVSQALHGSLSSGNVVGYSRVVQDQNIGGISAESTGEPILSEYSITYDNPTNAINVTFDHSLELKGDEQIFLFITYVRNKVNIPDDLKLLRSNRFDIKVLTDTFPSEDVNPDVLEFLVDYILNVKAFHSLLRKIIFTAEVNGIYNVQDFCVGGEVKQSAVSNAGNIYSAPLQSVVSNADNLQSSVSNADNCDSSVFDNLSQEDRDLRGEILSGLEEEFKAWKGLDGKYDITESQKSLFGTKSNITIRTTQDGVVCQHTEQGQDRKYFEIIDVDFEPDTRDKACDVSGTTQDYCYIGRVDGQLSILDTAKMEESISCNPCEIGLGKGSYFYAPDLNTQRVLLPPASTDTTESTVEGRVYKAVPSDSSVNPRISKGGFDRFSPLFYEGSHLLPPDAKEKLISHHLLHLPLGINKSNLFMPGHRFITMDKLVYDFESPDWCLREYDPSIEAMCFTDRCKDVEGVPGSHNLYETQKLFTFNGLPFGAPLSDWNTKWAVFLDDGASSLSEGNGVSLTIGLDNWIDPGETGDTEEALSSNPNLRALVGPSGLGLVGAIFQMKPDTKNFRVGFDVNNWEYNLIAFGNSTFPDQMSDDVASLPDVIDFGLIPKNKVIVYSHVKNQKDIDEGHYRIELSFQGFSYEQVYSRDYDVDQFSTQNPVVFEGKTYTSTRELSGTEDYGEGDLIYVRSEGFVGCTLIRRNPDGTEEELFYREIPPTELSLPNRNINNPDPIQSAISVSLEVDHWRDEYPIFKCDLSYHHIYDNQDGGFGLDQTVDFVNTISAINYTDTKDNNELNDKKGFVGFGLEVTSLEENSNQSIEIDNWRLDKQKEFNTSLVECPGDWNILTEEYLQNLYDASLEEEAASEEIDFDQEYTVTATSGDPDQTLVDFRDTLDLAEAYILANPGNAVKVTLEPASGEDVINITLSSSGLFSPAVETSQQTEAGSEGYLFWTEGTLEITATARIFATRPVGDSGAKWLRLYGIENVRLRNMELEQDLSTGTYFQGTIDSVTENTFTDGTGSFDTYFITPDPRLPIPPIDVFASRVVAIHRVDLTEIRIADDDNVSFFSNYPNERIRGITWNGSQFELEVWDDIRALFPAGSEVAVRGNAQLNAIHEIRSCKNVLLENYTIVDAVTNVMSGNGVNNLTIRNVTLKSRYPERIFVTGADCFRHQYSRAFPGEPSTVLIDNLQILGATGDDINNSNMLPLEIVPGSINLTDNTAELRRLVNGSFSIDMIDPTATHIRTWDLDGYIDIPLISLDVSAKTHSRNSDPAIIEVEDASLLREYNHLFTPGTEVNITMRNSYCKNLSPGALRCGGGPINNILMEDCQFDQVQGALVDTSIRYTAYTEGVPSEGTATFRRNTFNKVNIGLQSSDGMFIQRLGDTSGVDWNFDISLLDWRFERNTHTDCGGTLGSFHSLRSLYSCNNNVTNQDTLGYEVSDNINSTGSLDSSDVIVSTGYSVDTVSGSSVVGFGTCAAGFDDGETFESETLIPLESVYPGSDFFPDNEDLMAKVSPDGEVLGPDIDTTANVFFGVGDEFGDEFGDKFIHSRRLRFESDILFHTTSTNTVNAYTINMFADADRETFTSPQDALVVQLALTGGLDKVGLQISKLKDGSLTPVFTEFLGAYKDLTDIQGPDDQFHNFAAEALLTNEETARVRVYIDDVLVADEETEFLSEISAYGRDFFVQMTKIGSSGLRMAMKNISMTSYDLFDWEDGGELINVGGQDECVFRDKVSLFYCGNGQMPDMYNLGKQIQTKIETPLHRSGQRVTHKLWTSAQEAHESVSGETSLSTTDVETVENKGISFWKNLDIQSGGTSTGFDPTDATLLRSTSSGVMNPTFGALGVGTGSTPSEYAIAVPNVVNLKPNVRYSALFPSLNSYGLNNWGGHFIRAEWPFTDYGLKSQSEVESYTGYRIRVELITGVNDIELKLFRGDGFGGETLLATTLGDLDFASDLTTNIEIINEREGVRIRYRTITVKSDPNAWDLDHLDTSMEQKRTGGIFAHYAQTKNTSSALHVINDVDYQYWDDPESICLIDHGVNAPIYKSALSDHIYLSDEFYPVEQDEMRGSNVVTSGNTAGWLTNSSRFTIEFKVTGTERCWAQFDPNIYTNSPPNFDIFVRHEVNGIMTPWRVQKMFDTSQPDYATILLDNMDPSKGYRFEITGYRADFADLGSSDVVALATATRYYLVSDRNDEVTSEASWKFQGVLVEGGGRTVALPRPITRELNVMFAGDSIMEGTFEEVESVGSLSPLSAGSLTADATTNTSYANLALEAIKTSSGRRINLLSKAWGAYFMDVGGQNVAINPFDNDYWTKEAIEQTGLVSWNDNPPFAKTYWNRMDERTLEDEIKLDAIVIGFGTNDFVDYRTTYSPYYRFIGSSYQRRWVETLVSMMTKWPSAQIVIVLPFMEGIESAALNAQINRWIENAGQYLQNDRITIVDPRTDFESYQRLRYSNRVPLHPTLEDQANFGVDFEPFLARALGISS